MWARHFEIFLGLWLAISWLLFSYPSTMLSLIYVDWISCAFICIFSLSCYCNRFKYFNLMNFIVGWTLIGIVLTRSDDTNLPPYQNYVVIGLLLSMFSMIPTNSSQPPNDWLDFFKNIKKKQ